MEVPRRFHWAFHTSIPAWVEVLGVNRADGRVDVYILSDEPLTSELESHREQGGYVFFETIEARSNLDDSIPRVHAALGPGWEPVEYMRERGSRRTIGRIYDHLKAHGRWGWVRSEGDDWVLVVRRKDFGLASEVSRPDAR